jgi:hypothetical protein
VCIIRLMSHAQKERELIERQLVFIMHRNLMIETIRNFNKIVLFSERRMKYR